MIEALDCEAFGCLPDLPAVRNEQEAGNWLRMKYSLSVYRAFSAMGGQRNMAEWSNHNPGAARVIGAVRELQLQERDHGIDS